MKKTILLGAILVLGLFFVSCEKEGQYTPKNKIDRISYSSSTTFQMYLNDVWNDVGTSTVSKYVSEIWNWDGKMLKSITHYNDKGELMYTENYEYDGDIAPIWAVPAAAVTKPANIRPAWRNRTDEYCCK